MAYVNGSELARPDKCINRSAVYAENSPHFVRRKKGRRLRFIECFMLFHFYDSICYLAFVLFVPFKHGALLLSVHMRATVHERAKGNFRALLLLCSFVILPDLGENVSRCARLTFWMTRLGV